MSLYVTYTTARPAGLPAASALRPVARVFATQAEATAGGAAEGETAWHRGVSDDVRPGWWLVTGAGAGAGDVSEAPPATEKTALEKARVLAAARAHARACLDLMRPGWLIEDVVATGDARVDVTARWLNTRHWILGGGRCVAVAARDAGWTADQAEAALAAYQALVPADAGAIVTWYLAHTEATWTAYRAVSGGNAGAYLGWRRGQAIPQFASDAAAAQEWAGAAGSARPNAAFVPTTKPEAL